MSTSAFTPGPWTLAEVKDGGIKHLCPIDSEGLSVLTVVDQDGTPFGAIYTNEDARLMCAAPDLLTALRDLLAMCERQVDFNDDGDGGMFERAGAAIAKATGAPA